MSVLIWVLIITTVAGVGGTGLGGVVSALFTRDSKKMVSLLLSFAGGVMLSVVCFDLLMDALTTENSAFSGLGLAIIGTMIGYAVIALLNYAIDKSTNKEVVHVDEAHPKTADDLDELIHSDHLKSHEGESDPSNLFMAGVIMACAIALHNLPEGMVIGASYVGTTSANLWSGSGLIVACIIGVHNVPEGMAVAVPLMAGGMKKRKALFVTAASGLPTVIGALIGYLLGSMGAFWHALSLSFASGAMLYVVFGELLPESILMWKSKLPATAVLVGMLLGIVLIYS